MLHHLTQGVVDLDIENCQFVIVSQLLDKLQLVSPIFVETMGPIHECARERSAVSDPQRQRGASSDKSSGRSV